MRRTLACFAAGLCAALAGCAARSEFPSLRGPYLGQAPPGAEPALFAPGIVSTGLNERDLAASPDGSEIFYGIILGQRALIMRTRIEGGRWTEPEVAPFARDLDFCDLEPAFAPDGSRLFFLSTRPPAGAEPKAGWAYQNIWAVDRAPDGGWGEPHIVGPPVGTAGAEYFPSLTREGAIYFTRRAAGERRERIMRARLVDGAYAEAEALPVEVNGDWTIFNACIAPDESYLVACVAGKDPELAKGTVHYYAFFRGEDDAWSEGANLGNAINPPGAQAMSSSITPDGRYFFFASTKSRPLDAAAPGALSLGGIRAFFDGPQNGLFDIYWVETSVIRDLRPKSAAPR